jgi:hypothetical protein
MEGNTLLNFPLSLNSISASLISCFLTFLSTKLLLTIMLFEDDENPLVSESNLLPFLLLADDAYL